jgi:glycosyltransferase involved in cell wall biosynthesis
MRVAAVFSTNFLEYSQTFVHDEVTNHERYRVEVFCRRRLDARRFPFDAVHVAGPAYGITLRDRGFDALFAATRYSIVHAHFGPGAVYARGYAVRFRLPLVVTFHGYDVPLLRSRARFLPETLRYALVAPKILREMTLGLCASTELVEMLAALGVPRARLRHHTMGVDVNRFAPLADRSGNAGEPVRVAMVGRFVEKKGFEYGLRAFAETARTRRAELMLVGTGPLETRLRALSRDLRIDDRTSFAGVLDAGGVAAILRRTDVLLAPSVVARRGDRESGPLSIKEACASGVVPIATRHGGIPEIVEDGVTGVLVPERDVGALAARLATLIDDRELRVRLGDAGRTKMVRDYDLRARVRALESHYDEAIALHESGAASGSSRGRQKLRS